MATQWNHVEEAAIRQCLRDANNPIGEKTQLKKIAKILVQIDPSINEKLATEFLYNRSVKDESQRQSIIKAAMAFLKKNEKSWLHLYETGPTRDFLNSILKRSTEVHLPNAEITAGETPNDYLKLIANQWRVTFNSESDAIQTGVYQVMRRYKPFLSDQKGNSLGYDWNDPQNHGVIVELLMLDAERMECVCVNSKMNIYLGSITLNHDDILYGAMVRKLLGDGMVNFRFFALKVEGLAMSLASGIILKAGDTSKRPIASECIYARIPDREHPELYSAMQALHQGKGSLGDRERSVLLRYVTDPPPNDFYDPADPDPKWKRVKFVRDFPILSQLVNSDNDSQSSLREPSRSLPIGKLIDLSSQGRLPIFRWDE